MASAERLDLDSESAEYAAVYAWEHAFWGVQEAMNELVKALGPDREIDRALVDDVMAEMEDRIARSWAAYAEYLYRKGETEEPPSSDDAQWEIPMPEDFGDLELVNGHERD